MSRNPLKGLCFPYIYGSWNALLGSTFYELIVSKFSAESLSKSPGDFIVSSKKEFKFLLSLLPIPNAEVPASVFFKIDLLYNSFLRI